MLTFERAKVLIRHYDNLADLTCLLSGKRREHAEEEMRLIKGIFKHEAETAVVKAALTPEEEPVYQRLVEAFRGLFGATRLTRPVAEDKPIDPDGDYGRDDGLWHPYRDECLITAFEFGVSDMPEDLLSAKISRAWINAAAYEAIRKENMHGPWTYDDAPIMYPVYGKSGGFGGKSIVYLIQSR